MLLMTLVIPNLKQCAYFLFRIGLIHFWAGCRKRQLKLGYNLCRFILCCISVFEDLYFVDLVVVDLDL